MGRGRDESDNSIVAYVERLLRRRIADGTYREHSYIASERALAKELNTSRVTVAKALEALERDKLVMRSPGRGTRVLPVLDRLSRPLIGMIRADYSSADPANLRDGMSTLSGCRETLARLGFRFEELPCPESDADMPASFFDRFGAILIVENFPDPERLFELERRRVPIVVAKMEYAAWDLSATWVDHAEPIRQAVKVLYDLGHERIGFVGREPGYGFYGIAREGYIAGLQNMKLPFDESMIATCEKTDALAGYASMRKLLSLSNPPTAIIAARDCIAEGVCGAIKEAGLIVGHHMSVIGFDDTTWPDGRNFLTTFREPCYDMGAVAAEMLAERIVSGWRPPEKRQLETPFLLRRSAGPVLARKEIM